MSGKELRLRVVFAALDKLTAPLKKIRGASHAAGKEFKATVDKLKDLNRQQSAVGKFRELHSGLSATANRLQAAQQKIKSLAGELKATQHPTRELTRQFARAETAAKKIKEQFRLEQIELQKLRTELSKAGIQTGALRGAIERAGSRTANLGAHQRQLRADIAATTAKMHEQKKQLDALNARHQRTAKAQRHADKARAIGGHLIAGGVGATATGAAIGAPLAKGLHEAEHYQMEKARVTALGLGPQVSADAERFARNMQTYGTSHLENLELVRDSMSVFGDLQHAQMVAPTLAKMKFGNKAFYGEESGADNERKFMDMLKVIELRGGTASSEKFHDQANMVQRTVTATAGRVGPGEWLNTIKTGGVAVKGMDDEAFYYQLEPLVQEMGGHRVGTGAMSAYNNLYQGRTSKRAAANLQRLGLIGDQSKVRHDKAGQTAQLDPGALLGSDLFKKSQFEWMEKVLLPQLAKKGITEKGKILDTIGSIFSNRTAGDLHANMYLQRKQIRKNEKLNAGAYDIDQINTLGQQQAGGKELDAGAKLADLKLAMGEKILPLYAQGLEMATSSLTRLNAFMQENPTVAKAMIASFSILAGLLVVLGPLMLAMAAVIGPYAMLHVLFAKIGIAGGVLTPILRGLGSGFMALGKLLLANPILLVIAAIAAAAYLIYKNWEPIKAWFSALWDKMAGACGKAWEWIKAKSSAVLQILVDLFMNWSLLGIIIKHWDKIVAFLQGLRDTFLSVGGRMMDGLIDGFTNGLNGLKTAIGDVADKAVGWFREKLGIHSPSRVFASLGDFTMLGLAAGLQRSQDKPLAQVDGLAGRLQQLGAGVALGAAAMPAAAFDRRPPVAASAPGNVVMHGDTIHITIQPPPGADAAAIAREVNAVMDRRDRERAARRRSALHDY